MKTILFILAALSFQTLAQAADYRCATAGGDFTISESSSYDLKATEKGDYRVVNNVGETVGELALHQEKSARYWISADGKQVFATDQSGAPTFYYGEIYSCSLAN